MLGLSDILDQTIHLINRIKKNLSKVRTAQIRSVDERTMLKTTALTWFNSSRSQFDNVDPNLGLNAIDDYFRTLLEAAEKASARFKVLNICKQLRTELISLRSAIVTGVISSQIANKIGPPADISSLVTDSVMQNILSNRWKETELCLKYGANLAAVVMTGALLEALLLTRINSLKDKAPLFQMTCTPIRHGKPIPLSEWTLKNYIDAAHEMKWIRQSAKEISNVLRNYRNFVHPENELTQGITVNEQDAKLFWHILNSLAEQIVESVKLGG